MLVSAQVQIGFCTNIKVHLPVLLLVLTTFIPQLEGLLAEAVSGQLVPALNLIT